MLYSVLFPLLVTHVCTFSAMFTADLLVLTDMAEAADGKLGD